MTEEPPVSFEKQGSFEKQSSPGTPPGQAHPPQYPPVYGYGYPPPGYAPPGYGPPGYAGYFSYGPRPAGPPHEKPSSNIGWAIAAIFTFWPLAIPSFIFANKVDTAWFAGDRAGAQKASSDARLYGMIGVIVGAVFFVLAIVWFIVVFAVVVHATHDVPDYSPQPFPS